MKNNEIKYVLETKNLSKSIEDLEIIEDVNIHIREGEIYGFLGKNGAGKTTVMKLITNLWKPTSGTITIMNKVVTTNSYEYLKDLGIIIEIPTFYENLTARENLEIHCKYMNYNGKSRIKEVLKMVGLSSNDKKKVKHFSLGMRQRLGIARAIITNPKLLILDEPTNGLDPLGLKDMRELLKKLSRDYGITIMISTHILSEIESIVDTVGLIDNGRMIKEISINEIKNSEKSLEDYFINVVSGGDLV